MQAIIQFQSGNTYTVEAHLSDEVISTRAKSYNKFIDHGHELGEWEVFVRLEDGREFIGEYYNHTDQIGEITNLRPV